MATWRAPRILVSAMVAGTYIQWHSFICRLRDRRCAIERLGNGGVFLSFFPIHHPTQVTRPSLPDAPPGSTLPISVSRQDSGGPGPRQGKVSLRGGRDGW